MQLLVSTYAATSRMSTPAFDRERAIRKSKLRCQIESENNVLTRARMAPAERKREAVALYYLYRLFPEGGCKAVKPWGLYGSRLAFDPHRPYQYFLF
jgi:hypothetical protein